jgi:hypothetical protein
MKDSIKFTVALANQVPKFILESNTLQMRILESRLILQPVTNQPVKVNVGEPNQCQPRIRCPADEPKIKSNKKGAV